MRFSMEVPTVYLQRWESQTDLSFALAHRVLIDPVYAGFYAHRPKGRQLILDNSMHELGEPLSLRELFAAASIVHADWIVPPDQLGKPDWNLAQYREAVKFFKERFSVAAVMCGRSAAERRKYLRAVDQAAMIMLPYREPRLDWFKEQEDLFERFPWIHLLGVNTLSELSAFVRISNGSTLWSVDTGKPVVAAICNRPLTGDLRNMPVHSKALLELQGLTPEQLKAVDDNISAFKAICRGEIGVDG